MCRKKYLYTVLTGSLVTISLATTFVHADSSQEDGASEYSYNGEEALNEFKIFNEYDFEADELEYFVDRTIVSKGPRFELPPRVQNAVAWLLLRYIAFIEYCSASWGRVRQFFTKK